MATSITNAEIGMSVAQARLQAKLTAQPNAFDPTTIIAIIQAIISAISNCKPPTGGTTPPPVTHLKNRSIVNELAVRRALRDEGFRPLSGQMRSAVDAVFAVAADSTDEDVAAFVTHCC